MADDQTNQNDAVDERQTQPRTGIPGKGFDAGTGYGGAGNDALYNGESAYGGQSAQANNSLGGAYQGEGYGRPGDDDAGQGDAPEGGQGGGQNVARDTDGRGSENQGRDVQMDPDTEAVTQAFEGAGSGGAGSGSAGRDDAPASGISRDGPDAIDLQDMSGASRREPGR